MHTIRHNPEQLFPQSRNYGHAMEETPVESA